MSPSCAYSFFISQNWEGGRPGTQSAHQPSPTFYNVRGRPHPDNKLNTKVLGGDWSSLCFVVFVRPVGRALGPSGGRAVID